MKKTQKYCTHCHLIHDVNEVKRVYGKESFVLAGGFCSANCYTKHVTKMNAIAPIKWTMCGLQYGGWPEMSKRPNCKNECSDVLLVFCEDGEIRTGRFYEKGCNWMVTGVCGAPQGFVRYWSSCNITDEAEKMEFRMKADEKWIKEAADFCALGSNVTDV